MTEKMYPADLHMHTLHSDGFALPETMMDRAVKRRMKCIAITDHNYAVDLRKKQGEPFSEVGKRFGAELAIPGVELTCPWEHHLIYGVDPKKMQEQLGIWGFGQREARYQGCLRQVDDMLRWSIDQGGVTIAAHPLMPLPYGSIRFLRLHDLWDRGLIIGAEIMNYTSGIPYDWDPRLRGFLRRMRESAMDTIGITLRVANSDAHFPAYIARYHTEFWEGDPIGEPSDFLQKIQVSKHSVKLHGTIRPP